MKKILFLAPYPLSEAPSQRFRFEQYFKVLEEKGFGFDFQSFLSEKGWRVLYKPGKPLQKFWQVLLGYARRKTLLLKLYKYDFVFVHREVAPLGPPIFEWMIAKVFGKKIVYDFDDAIWLADEGDLNGILLKLKWHKKVASICKWSYKVSCGNEYLRQYALQFNSQSFYNPTTIDTVELHNQTKTHQEGRVNIGWTGTHSTLKFLEPIWPVLKELEGRFNTRFILISNRAPEVHPLNNLGFIPWHKGTEIEDLMKIDIGIMPLVNDAWSEGKCGFKALQYMALGIPAVASPVGVNKTIIHSGDNGYLSDSHQEWVENISKLIGDVSLRKDLGLKGQATIQANYSVQSNWANFLALFS